MTHFVPPPVVGILLLACSSPAWASQSPPDTTKYQAVNDSFALILAEYLDPRLASARDSGPSLYMVATTRRTFSCLLPLGMSLNSRGATSTCTWPACQGARSSVQVPSVRPP